MLRCEARAEVFLLPFKRGTPPLSILSAITTHVQRINGERVSYAEKEDCYFIGFKNSHYTVIFKISMPNDKNDWGWKVHKIIKNGDSR